MILSGTDNVAPVDAEVNGKTLKRHPEYWFEDGSLLINVEDTQFRVHHSLLSRHSPALRGYTSEAADNQEIFRANSVQAISIPVNVLKRLYAKDVDVLLQYLYRDLDLSLTTPFSPLASLLRVSSSTQLDFPRVHDQTRALFTTMFHGSHTPFIHPTENLKEALQLSRDFDVKEIQKPIFYSLMTASDLEPEVPPEDKQFDPAISNGAEAIPRLSDEDALACSNAMRETISYFTPILFTPPATPHMDCTNVFAETWMDCIIQPAIESSGVYKPLETLELMKETDWQKKGLCAACVDEKRDEWTREQLCVWDKFDSWLRPQFVCFMFQSHASIMLRRSLRRSLHLTKSYNRAMTRQITLDASPPVHREMTDSLDKNAFKKTISVLAASVPASKTGLVLKHETMRGSVINLPKVRSVVSHPSGVQDQRLVLFRFTDEADLRSETRNFLKDHSSGFTQYKIDLDYDYWTADEILQAILPENLLEGSPTGFAMTGHIAHVNLNEEYLPYKHIIGQLILDKNKKVKTVVNKLDNIDTKFRFFKMELIAGESRYIVEHRESDCRFTFDFSQVYWNSRLHTEHDRLVQMFKPGDVVADVFAGVGPFAIPAAKKGCAVLANDLNPNSAKYLEQNVQDNKVSELVRVSCEDGKDFIQAAVKRVTGMPFPAYVGQKNSRTQEKVKRRKREVMGNSVPIPQTAEVRNRISHFVMNLPDSAITFLASFRGIYSSLNGDDWKPDEMMPMIHCHCFTRELERVKAEPDIRQRVEEQLGHSLSEEVSFHLVRSVAPNKEMYCVSFRLPKDVAFAAR